MNAAIPPSDLNSYLMRRLAQREVCNPGDYTEGYVALFIGVIIAGIAWHTLLPPKAGESQELNDAP